MTLQDIVDTITNAFELEPLLPTSTGSYHFSLDQDIDIDLFSPNSNISIFFGKLYSVENNDTITNTIIKECARIAIGVAKKKRSIVSIKENNLELHLVVKNEYIELFPDYMKSFASDMHWWKEQIDKYKNQPSSFNSPYGGGMLIP